MEQKSYRVYVTDALQAIAENTAIDANKFLDELVGKAMSRRWTDLGKPVPPSETRTAEEIIADIKNKLASL